jgi:hypothetical protein
MSTKTVLGVALCSMMLNVASSAEFVQLMDTPIEVDLRATGVCSASLSGVIAAGDADKLQSYVDLMKPFFDPASDAPQQFEGYNGDGLTLCISGPGGSYSEALKIIEILSESLIDTVVPENAQCLSACAVAFMGGFYGDEASRSPAREIKPGADLGFHAPAIAISGNSPMPPQMVEAAYETALSDIQGVLTTLLVNFNFSNDPRMRPSLFAEMLGTPPDEMFHVTTIDQIGRWSINFDDGENDSLNFSEANLIQVCKNLESWRTDRTSISTAEYSSAGDFPEVTVEQVENISEYNDNTIYKYTISDGMFNTECTFHVPSGIQRVEDNAIRVEVYSEDDMLREDVWPYTWQYLNPTMTLVDAVSRGE